MRQFRSSHPTRSVGVPLENNYSRYRSQLAKDFNGRCGYTDCSHRHWFGGFEIDHFAPLKPALEDIEKKAAFAVLECTYSNLVYACPSINRAKGNDWAGDSPDEPTKDGRGYLDPCDNNYNEYFYRTDGGQIMPKDHPISQYMWSKLNLYLKRYEIYWRIDWLFEQMTILQDAIKNSDLDGEQLKRVRSLLDELLAKYIEYMWYIDVNYSEVTRT